MSTGQISVNQVPTSSFIKFKQNEDKLTTLIYTKVVGFHKIESMANEKFYHSKTSYICLLLDSAI